jgi:hypothetical protein
VTVFQPARLSRELLYRKLHPRSGEAGTSAISRFVHGAPDEPSGRPATISGENGADRVDYSIHIDPPHALHRHWIVGFQRPRHRHAGVVYQDADRSQLGLGACRHARHRAGISNVCLHCDGLPTCTSNLGDNPFRFIFAGRVVYADGCAMPGEPTCNRRPMPREAPVTIATWPVQAIEPPLVALRQLSLASMRRASANVIINVIGSIGDARKPCRS